MLYLLLLIQEDTKWTSRMHVAVGTSSNKVPYLTLDYQFGAYPAISSQASTAPALVDKIVFDPRQLCPAASRSSATSKPQQATVWKSRLLLAREKPGGGRASALTAGCTTRELLLPVLGHCWDRFGVVPTMATKSPRSVDRPRSGVALYPYDFPILRRLHLSLYQPLCMHIIYFPTVQIRSNILDLRPSFGRAAAVL